MNPEALPAPPGPQFKVQVNPSAGTAAAAGTPASHSTTGAAAGATAAAGAASDKAAKPAAGTAAATAASVAGASGSKSGAAVSTAAGKAAGGSKAAAQASPFYVEQASRAQPPLLQSLKPSAGGLLLLAMGIDASDACGVQRNVQPNAQWEARNAMPCVGCCCCHYAQNHISSLLSCCMWLPPVHHPEFQ